MTFWKRQNHEGIKKVSGCQGLGGREGVNGRAQMLFRAMKKKSRFIAVTVILQMVCTR